MHLRNNYPHFIISDINNNQWYLIYPPLFHCHRGQGGICAPEPLYQNLVNIFWSLEMFLFVIPPYIWKTMNYFVIVRPIISAKIWQYTSLRISFDRWSFKCVKKKGGLSCRAHNYSGYFKWLRWMCTLNILMVEN